MTISLLFPEEGVLFGTQVPPEINALLQQAVAAYEDTERAESLLLEARRRAPRQLEVYIALYKFYFYKFRLEQAETAAGEALIRCAELGGFSQNWRDLTPGGADWRVAEGPPRVYLYTLKALSFIRLRRGDSATAGEILEKLRELDPEDQVGAEVLRDLAAGVEGGEDGYPFKGTSSK